MDQLLPLLAAFGLGSVVTALVQSALTNRTKRFDRIFAEKQAAYVGLLEAYHRSGVESANEEARRSVEYWLARCDLVGSRAVREAIDEMFGSESRRTGNDELRRAMRDDLKILD